MKVKNQITILFIFLCFSISKAQENKIQKKSYTDIIEISNDVFYKRSQSKKYKERNAMYVTLDYCNESIYNYLVTQNDKGELKRKFKKQSYLYNKLFNKKEVLFYKKQLSEDKFKFSHCDIETDSIFVFNKNRDHHAYTGNRLRSININNTENLSIPLFTKNHKYGIVFSSNIQGGWYLVYEKKNGKWVEIFSFDSYTS